MRKDLLGFSQFGKNRMFSNLALIDCFRQLVTTFHKPECRISHHTALPEYRVPKQIDDLVQAHSALIGLLESTIVSPATRRQLEVFREELEREIESFQKSRNVTSEV
jgi:hypothetical protein